MTEENNSPGTLVTKQEFREEEGGDMKCATRVFSAGDLDGCGTWPQLANNTRVDDGVKEREGGREEGAIDFLTTL